MTLWVNVARAAHWPTPRSARRSARASDRQQLSSKGEYGYEAPATSSSGLTLPEQQQFLDPKLANDLSPTANASKVSSILTADAQKDSKGIWAKNGQEISFSVEDRPPSPTTTRTPS